MNKKLSLILYHTGLLVGIVVINYMLFNHKEYTDSIMESFQNIKHMENICGQDLFVYLFLKRGKQIAIIMFLFIQISQYGVMLLLDLCVAFIVSSFLSLCTFYYDMLIALKMAILLIPQYSGYVLFKNIGEKYIDRRKVDRSINIIKVGVYAIVVTIVLAIIEIIINLTLFNKIFPYK